MGLICEFGVVALLLSVSYVYVCGGFVVNSVAYFHSLICSFVLLFV